MPTMRRLKYRKFPMFIPIGDDNSRRRRFPFIVLGLVLLNVFVWYLQLTLGESFSASWAAIPFELSHGVDLIDTQHLYVHGETYDIPNGPGPSPLDLTAASSMFMHGSLMHLIGNMLYLIIFGDQIEDELGHFKFLVFYVVAGLVAVYVQVRSDPSSILPCVGASGAIAGVLGAYLVVHPLNRVRVLFFNSFLDLPALLVLGFWGVLQILGQATAPVGQGGVAYGAHLGGLVAGLVVGLYLRL